MFRASDFYPATKLPSSVSSQNAIDNGEMPNLADNFNQDISTDDTKPAMFFVLIFALLVGIRLVYEFME